VEQREGSSKKRLFVMVQWQFGEERLCTFVLCWMFSRNQINSSQALLCVSICLLPFFLSVALWKKGIALGMMFLFTTFAQQ
jgi:hypothetical protein